MARPIICDYDQHCRPVARSNWLLWPTPQAAFGFSLIAELFAVRAEATRPVARSILAGLCGRHRRLVALSACCYGQHRRPELLSGCAHKAAAIVTTIYVCVGLIGALAFESPQSNLLEASASL